MTGSNQRLIDDIVSRLSRLDPQRIVLFGSQASGTDRNGSDIDLLVVLDSNAVSQNYQEIMEKKLSVRNQILDYNKFVAVDIVVYTKAEFEILKKANASFIKEINRTGKILYEKSNTGVA